MELIENIIALIPSLILGGIGTFIVILAIEIVVAILIIRAICNYMAKKNAEAFNYDKLATRTAEEVCKRLMIIENQKKERTENQGSEE